MYKPSKSFLEFTDDMITLSYDSDGNLGSSFERLKDITDRLGNNVGFDYMGAIPYSVNFKADKTYKVGDMVTIQDESDFYDHSERWTVAGSTELGYQDGILKYVSTGELTYTGKEPFSGDFVLESTPNCKKGYFYNTCFPPKSSYYGESIVSDIKLHNKALSTDEIKSEYNKIEPLKVLDIFGEVYGYKRTIKGIRRFVNPYESLDKNILVNKNGVLEYGNKFAVDFGKPNHDHWCISHTAKISGDAYDSSK